jgi:excisionase family DNA binding protein
MCHKPLHHVKPRSYALALRKASRCILEVDVNNNERALIGAPEAARQLGIDVKTVRKMAETGEMPSVRAGRNLKIPAWWLRQQKDGPAPKAA